MIFINYLNWQLSQSVIISGLDTVELLLTGYSHEGLVTSAEMVSELLFTGDEWDRPLFKSLKFQWISFLKLVIQRRY